MNTHQKQQQKNEKYCESEEKEIYFKIYAKMKNKHDLDDAQEIVVISFGAFFMMLGVFFFCCCALYPNSTFVY